MKIHARLGADIAEGVKISRLRMSSCIGRRTHLLRSRLRCHHQSPQLLMIMPRTRERYHVAVGRGGQPITAPRHTPSNTTVDELR
jgi:arylamine N-acetyltransferase